MKFILQAISLVLLVFSSSQVTAYEVCNPQNEYLEAGLPALPLFFRDPLLPMACVETSQLTLAPTGYYGYCVDDNGKPGRTHPRPCISEKYVASVYSGLSDVAECFDYDPRWAFSVFNLESALHLNAVGAATDIGIGQLTTSAINEVNLNVLPRAIRLAKVSSLDSCKRILNDLFEGEASVDLRCSFISLPRNPVHNISFGILLLKRNRQILENYLNRWELVLPPNVDAERLKTLLSMLGYNAGVGGVAATLRTYVMQYIGILSDQQFDFESRSPGSFVAFLRDNFPSNSEVTRMRVSKYVGYILKSIRNVESNLNKGMCSDPSLVNPPIQSSRSFNKSRTKTHTHSDLANDIEANLSDIAHSMSEVKPLSAQDCKQMQAEFQYVFNPRASDLAELPAVVSRAYRSLCASLKR